MIQTVRWAKASIITALIAVACVATVDATNGWYRLRSAAPIRGGAHLEAAIPHQPPMQLLRAPNRLAPHGSLAQSTPTFVPSAVLTRDASNLDVSNARRRSADRAADVGVLRGYDAAAPPSSLQA